MYVIGGADWVSIIFNYHHHHFSFNLLPHPAEYKNTYQRVRVTQSEMSVVHSRRFFSIMKII